MLLSSTFGGLCLRNDIEQKIESLAKPTTNSAYELVTPSLDDARLAAFVSGHPDGLIFHHPAYLRALEEESGGQCIVLACQNGDASLQAVLPLFYTRGLSFNIGHHQTKRRLCSLPRTPMAGVLSNSSAATKCVLDEAIRRAQAEPGVQLQIKSAVPLPELGDSDLVPEQWRPTYVLTLPSGGRPRFGDARTRHNLKWAVSKAGKLGVTLRPAENEDDLRRWHELYLCTMRRNAVPPRSYKLFLGLWHHLRPRGLMSLTLAELELSGKKVLVGGSIFLMSGQTVFYAFTGSSAEHSYSHANDLILWNAIEVACRDGFRYFDLGEVAEDHPELAQFKKKWGSEPQPLYRYYYPAPYFSNRTHPAGAMGRLARRAWRLLPLRVTDWFGELIYAYL